MDTNTNDKVIEKELSYKIVGILFEAHTQLGGKFPEKVYQKAVEKLLIRERLNYKKELPVNLTFEGDKIGQYFLDFLIEEKVVLELKAVTRFRPEDFKQVLYYLKATNLELGILANFKSSKLSYKRILNRNSNS